MEVAANLFSFIGYLIDVIIGFRYNVKSKIILFSIISSSCSLAAMFLLHSLAGCIGVTVTIIRLVIIYLKDKYCWKIDWIFFLFVIGYCNIFFDADIFVAIFMFLGNIIMLFSKWFLKKVQYLRIGTFLANLIFIFPNFKIHNYSAVLFLLFNIVMLLLSYYKWYLIEKHTMISKG